MFGSTNTAFSGASSFGTFGSTSATTNTLGLGTLDNPMKDIEVQAPTDDTVSALKFSPKADFLIGSSWANDVSIVNLHCGHRCFQSVATTQFQNEIEKFEIPIDL